MKLRTVAGAIGVLAVAITTAVLADTLNPLPLHVDRVDEKIVLVRSGEQYFDSVLVLASKRGLVLIDTGIAPSLTRTYRAKIEESLGRSDFAWVINTHSHFDHFDGNQVFPKATVISSERARERMNEWNRDRMTAVARERGRVEEWTRQAESAEEGSARRVRLSNLATLYGRMADDVANDFTFVAPSITFNDRMTLDLGDMTAHLYAYGSGTHAGDDVIVHVPEIGLVAVGDLFAPTYLQVVDRNEPGVDLDHKLAVLDTVLSDETASRIVINGHGARMSRAELVARRDYLAALVRAAREEVAAGGTLSGLHQRLTLDGDLAYLKASGIPDAQLAFEHRATLTATWMVVKGLEDATAVVARIVREQGADTARAEFERIFPQRDDCYFIDEAALNRLGYALLGEGRPADAVAVFEMNVKAFPDSWNVHDSLGEALAANGDRERAIASYERSLQLNAQNTNAAAALERLRAGQ